MVNFVIIKYLTFLVGNIQDPPERPEGHDPEGTIDFQLWSISGETCPEGTIPIRRTTEHDILRASSVKRFGRKPRRYVRRDMNSNGHEVIKTSSYQNQKLNFVYASNTSLVSQVS